MGETRRSKRLLAVGILAAIAGLVLIAGVIREGLRDCQELLILAEQASANGDYELAGRFVGRAYEKATDRQQRKDILFRLADIYTKMDLWPKAQACWERICQEDPCDVKAPLALLEVEYLQADAWTRLGAVQTDAWGSLQARAEGLFRTIESLGLEDQPVADWRTDPLTRLISDGEKVRIGSYLMLIKGRTMYHRASYGAAANPMEVLEQAYRQLEAAIGDDPNLIDGYWYMHRIQLAKARLLAASGDRTGAERSRQVGMSVLEKARRTAGDTARTNMYLLEARLAFVLEQTRASDVAIGLNGLEPGYRDLNSRFSNEPQALLSCARFYLLQAYYQGLKQRAKYLDEAAAAAEKARSLEPNDPAYILSLAKIYWQSAGLTGAKELAQKALELAIYAAKLGQTQAGSGPKALVARATLLQAYDFVCHCATVQLLGLMSEDRGPQYQQAVALLSDAVERMVGISPSSQDPAVMKCQAFLDLFNHKTEQAFAVLYHLGQKQKTARQDGYADPLIYYVLAKVLSCGPELGRAAEFFAESIKAGMGLERPDTILEYLDLLGRLGRWAHVISPVNPYNLDTFDRLFGQGPWSIGLRVMALIGTNQLAEAESILAANQAHAQTCPLILARVELLEAKIRQIRTSQAVAGMSPDLVIDDQGLEESPGTDPQLRELRQEQSELVFRLLDIDPGKVTEQMIVSAVRILVQKGLADQARERLERFLQTRPTGTRPPVMAMFARATLDEPDPRYIPGQRRDQILQQVISDLADPVQRALELGLFYRQSDSLQQAKEQLVAAMELSKDTDWSTRQPPIRQLYSSPLAITADVLMELAIVLKDRVLAQNVVDLAKARDLDGCKGLYYQARMLYADGQPRQALKYIEKALAERPVFSSGYLLRASIYSDLGQDELAVADMEHAARLCPNSPAVARGLAVSLYHMARRHAQGEELSAQVRSAIEQALRLVPADPVLLSLYGEAIRVSEPFRAMQVYQLLLKRQPTARNALALASLASELADRQQVGPRRDNLLEIARIALEHAYAQDPNNPAIIEEYVEYYRKTGQHQKAEQMLWRLAKAANWRVLINQGRLQQARSLLERAIQIDPNDLDALNGLIIVCQITGDQQGLINYSDRVVQLQPGPSGRIEQLLLLLHAGLVRQAQARLEHLRSLYPDHDDMGALEALILLYKGRLSDAVEKARQATATNPESAMAWMVNGQVSMLCGQFDTAAESYKRSLELKDDPSIRLSLTDAYRLAGQIDKAYDILLGMLSEPSIAWQAVSSIERLCQDPNCNLVKQAYQIAHGNFSSHHRWLNRIGGFAVSIGDFAWARRAFEESIRLLADAFRQSPSEALEANTDYLSAIDGYIHSLIELAGNDKAQIEAVLKEASVYVRGPLRPRLLCWTAKARKLLGDMDGSLADARQAMASSAEDIDQLDQVITRLCAIFDPNQLDLEADSIGPDRLQTWTVKAQLAMQLGRYDAAIAALDRCLSIAGTQRPDLLAYKGQALVIAYDRTADKRYLYQAIALYERLADQMSNDSGVLNNLAYLLAHVPDRSEKALELASRALELDVQNPAVMDTYGYALYANGRFKEALDWLLAAVTRFQINGQQVPADVYEHTAMAYQALGQNARARQAYQQALAAAGENVVARNRIRAALDRLGPEQGIEDDQ